MLALAIAATLLPVYAAAQTVHTVTVAESGLSFTPNNVDGVNDGDIVSFVFNAEGHTVTQSTLAAPCTPVDGGFNSGRSSNAGDTYNLTITDSSKPIWFFCATTQPIIHCEQGMVGAINSPDDAFATYSSAAKAATNTPSVTGTLNGAEVASASPIAPPASGASDSGSATSDSAPSETSNAALPMAGFESIGATVLALFGALLF